MTYSFFKYVSTIIATLLFISACSLPEHAYERTYNTQDRAFENIVESTPPYHIIFFNIGQGDATLIHTPEGKTILIDTGPMDNAHIIQSYLYAQGIHTLDAIFITHYHADHIGGLRSILIGPDNTMHTDDDMAITLGIIDRGHDSRANALSLYSTYDDSAHEYRHTAYSGDTYTFGNMLISVIAVNGQVVNNDLRMDMALDENAKSLCLRITINDRHIFIGGDITGGNDLPPDQTLDMETPISIELGDIDILKVSHHGSITSTNATFLANTQPELAIISAGNENDYGHPHFTVIDRLHANDIDIHATQAGHLSELHPATVHNDNIHLYISSSGNYWIE